MKTLKEINRQLMPQIKGNNIINLILILKKNNIIYKYIKIQCDLLQASQDTINNKKVDSIAYDIYNNKHLDPIIISNDNFIIDGHHRWLAYKKLNINYIIALKIDLPKNKCLVLLKKIEKIRG